MQEPSARPFKPFAVVSHPAVLSLVLVLAVAALYGPFLGNPLVFDDKPLFTAGSLLGNALVPSPLGARWVSSTTLAWTRELFGVGIIPFRVGNLLLHAATAVALFAFLRRLFERTVPDSERSNATSRTFLAFIGALLFALHPVAVYAAAYLVQRSMLMATLFCLLMWYAYIEGLARQKQGLLLLSALCYYLAVFSKELSVMAPAVALGLTLLLRKPSFALVKMIAPAYVLYAAVALLALLNALDIVGTAYEPLVKASLADVPERAWLLSAVNQSFLFFKYLLRWIIPYPGWMAVDMRMPFPESAFALPQALGPLAFVATATGAVLLLLRGRRAETRLAGFALLAPVVLFLTEFSTVRIQEPFVLYRSYYWFGLLFAALPALAPYVGAKTLALSVTILSLVLIPVSRDRVTTFSDPVLLWSDAVAWATSTPNARDVDRVYYNRGNARLAKGQTQAAAEDFSKAIEFNPASQGAYNNRGYIHYRAGRYREAISDFQAAIEIDPSARRPLYALGMAYRAAGQEQPAREYLRRSCDSSYEPACRRLENSDTEGDSDR